MRKKIFFLINSLETGGGERVVIELSEKLSKNHDTRIITLKNAHEMKTSTALEKLTPAKGNISSTLILPISVLKLKKLIKKEHPDAVVSFFEMSNFVNVLAKTPGTKCVISARSVLSEVYKSGGRGLLYRKLIRKLYPKADLILANSRVSMKDLADSFDIPEKKISYVYNPVNLSRAKKDWSEKIEPELERLFSKNKVIINSGRLIPVKNQKNLIRIFSLVKKEVADAKLVILGDGPLKNELREYSSNLGLENDVLLLGNKNNPFKYLKKSSVFAFTSYYEGFPNALMEAAACGLPIISTDCRSGPREILAPQSDPFKKINSVEYAKFGVLVPNLGDIWREEVSSAEKEYARGLIKILKNKKMQESYSKISRVRAQDFNIDKIAGEFLKKVGV